MQRLFGGGLGFPGQSASRLPSIEFGDRAEALAWRVIVEKHDIIAHAELIDRVRSSERVHQIILQHSGHETARPESVFDPLLHSVAHIIWQAREAR